jgi:hypothetical protein
MALGPRKREKVRYVHDGLPIPKAPPRGRAKAKRYTNREHLSWLHDWSCIIADLGECDGPVVVHHLLQPWVGTRGTGRKCDDRNCIPICDGHHKELHDPFGRDDTFFEAKVGRPDLGREYARNLWENSPHKEDVS